MPGDASHDSQRSEWTAAWRGEVAERTRLAKADGSDVRLLVKAHIDACDACKAANGAEADPDSPPDPPVSGCTSPRGCMCTFTSKVAMK
jgi:hypothetical protein